MLLRWPNYPLGGIIMGIFTRFRDIVSSNINSMLDRAEDPEKMIKLMIREMEDTLIELKAACAGVMAAGKKVQRQLDEMDTRAQYWEEKAALAVQKGRDDLAREALVEKRRYLRRKDALEEERGELQLLVEGYQKDIRQLEEKLKSAREKQRMLVQRHIHARKKRRAQEEIRRLDSSEVMFKFDDLESRIERMESEADLVNFGKKAALEEELDKLTVDDEIEAELEALKKPVAEARKENIDSSAV
jgi:phage shock protein A